MRRRWGERVVHETACSVSSDGRSHVTPKRFLLKLLASSQTSFKHAGGEESMHIALL